MKANSANITKLACILIQKIVVLNDLCKAVCRSEEAESVPAKHRMRALPKETATLPVFTIRMPAYA